ncbi:MAG: nitroreductase [Marmoricola sp.]|nr:nitroreductase [Marmoricola sp.]
MDKKPKGIDDPGAVRFMKVMAAANVWLFRRTGGRVGSHWRIGAGWRNPVPICLVEHTGRRTGLPRTTPLVYLVDGENIVVVASQAGRPENPMWFGNVVASPESSSRWVGYAARCAPGSPTRPNAACCGPSSSRSTRTTTATSRGPIG